MVYINQTARLLSDMKGQRHGLPVGSSWWFGCGMAPWLQSQPTFPQYKSAGIPPRNGEKVKGDFVIWLNREWGIHKGMNEEIGEKMAIMEKGKNKCSFRYRCLEVTLPIRSQPTSWLLATFQSIQTRNYQHQNPGFQRI